jgi:hypothetical protein
MYLRGCFFGFGVRLRSHSRERNMGLGREQDLDRIIGAHLPACEDNPHDPGFPDQPAVRPASEHRFHEAGLKTVELKAGISQAGHLDHRLGAEPKPRAGRKREKVQSGGRDVLTHGAGRYVEPRSPKLVEQFGLDEMHLPQVRLGGIACDTGPMLHRLAGMSVAFDAKPGEEMDPVPGRLGK